MADDNAWGALILVREADAPEFEHRNTELLARASPLFARAVRRGLVTELIPPAKTYIPEFSPLEMGEVSPQGVARALENLYRDPARRQELARAAVAAAHNPAHSWDVITRQFDDLIVALATAPQVVE